MTAEQERAAVVDWLNSHGMYLTAKKIERGDHLTDRPAP
jgi:hypothetical protein